MKDVFDVHYKMKFVEAGLLTICRGELQHFLSDVDDEFDKMIFIEKVKFIIQNIYFN